MLFFSSLTHQFFCDPCLIQYCRGTVIPQYKYCCETTPKMEEDIVVNRMVWLNMVQFNECVIK